MVPCGCLQELASNGVPLECLPDFLRTRDLKRISGLAVDVRHATECTSVD